jgi:hypothetical protein
VGQLVVVAHPEPLPIDARQIEVDSLPDDGLALAYYYQGNVIARGVVPAGAVNAIRRLLSTPVSVALAASEDDDGNIEARVCLVLPVGSSSFLQEFEDDEDQEPWKASVPPPPPGIESGADFDGPGRDRPHITLLPIGNVVRSARDRNHPEDVPADVREMLENLLAGRGRDAVSKAIDDLLDSI